jgi:hypothetical protein
LLGKRREAPILGGQFEGKRSGEILPGGADWHCFSHATPQIMEQLYAGENAYAWLNRIVAVCSDARTSTQVLLDFYEVT